MQKVVRAAVVEDEEDDFLMLTDLLRREPFYRVSADWLSQPGEAVRSILEGDYQIVFLDYKMGPVSGLAIARELRAMDYDLPIVMVTGVGNAGIERAAIHADIDYFLAKDQLNEALISTTLHFGVAGWLTKSGMRGNRHMLTGLPRRRLFQELLGAAATVVADHLTLELGLVGAELHPVEAGCQPDAYDEQHAWRELILRLQSALPSTALIGHLGPRTVGCMISGDAQSRAGMRDALEHCVTTPLAAAGSTWAVKCRFDWRTHASGWSGSEWVLQAGIRPSKKSNGAVHSADSALTPADMAVRHQGRRALMVEDNRVNQLLAKKMLESLGLACDLAGNGEEAVRRASADHYDIIFMDIEMPVMDGFEAASRLRDQRLSVTPIVALTAREDEGVRQHCRKVHMNGYLLKPLRKAQLSRVLDRIFNL